ncbi:neutral/alkaline non-lysosomal ceramidase N-terminal domain-containing protein [Singulisphaera sp. PoT]|uniref:neutral/alkaline non-lysosomal ceramidase N-terminal domain-containing protein n=1 Tax=Singulisphaera sp. PoT TaxID=3411797 RepID=UPI003BF5B1A7
MTGWHESRGREGRAHAGLRSIFGVALGTFVLASLAGSDVRAAEGFRAGAYAADITPQKFPISMNGQMVDQRAMSAFDKLHARCLVLDDGKAPIAFVVVDSCVVSRAIFDAAKERIQKSTGIRTDRMMMSATHTHTAPAVTGAFQTEPDKEYVAFLTDKIVEGVERAYKQLEPAQVAWGVGQNTSQVFCRDWIMKPNTAQTNPFGGTTNDQVQMHPGYQNPNAIKPTSPVDADVSILAVKSSSGRPISVLANYSMHYAGYGIPAASASADYFGRFSERIKTLVGAESVDPPFVGMLSNGTAANMHCYDYSQPKKPVTIDTVAESVAGTALDVYKSLSFRDDVKFVMQEVKMRLKLRLPSADEVARAKEVLSKAQGRVLRDYNEIYARESVLLSEGPPEVEFKLQALKLGDLGIAAIPCEVFSETGLAIKKGSPLKPTFTIELANGYNGYLPPPERHAMGGYETWRARSSCLEIEAEPKIRAEVLRLLESVAKSSE